MGISFLKFMDKELKLCVFNEKTTKIIDYYVSFCYNFQLSDMKNVNVFGG